MSKSLYLICITSEALLEVGSKYAYELYEFAFSLPLTPVYPIGERTPSLASSPFPYSQYPGDSTLNLSSPSTRTSPLPIPNNSTLLFLQSMLSSSYSSAPIAPENMYTLLTVRASFFCCSRSSRSPFIWSESGCVINTASISPTPIHFRHGIILYSPTFFTLDEPPSITYTFLLSFLIIMQSPCPTSSI